MQSALNKACWSKKFLSSFHENRWKSAIFTEFLTKIWKFWETLSKDGQQFNVYRKYK